MYAYASLASLSSLLQFAHPPPPPPPLVQYIIIQLGALGLVDGTSASAPVFAAIIGLANSARLAVGLSVSSLRPAGVDRLYVCLSYRVRRPGWVVWVSGR